MHKPDFSLTPNLHTILVSLALLIVASSTASTFLPEFLFQITTQVESSVDLERESEKELNQLEDDQKQILLECDQYLCPDTDNIFQGKSVGFPGFYPFTFTPPPELI